MGVSTSSWSDKLVMGSQSFLASSRRNGRALHLGLTLLAGAALPAFTKAGVAQNAEEPARLERRITASEPIAVKSALDMARKWDSTHGLYVKGDIGLSQDQLKEIASWLRQYPNWTVFLTEQAQGESYLDANGRTYHNQEAIENIIGKELPNKTGFGSMKDPESGHPNGVVFYISFDKNLQYRKLGLNTSVLMEKHGINEGQWQGNMDQPGVYALKNGRRVADAIKDTVKSIEGRLAFNIEQEKSRKVELERSAGILVKEAVKGLSALEESLKSFSRQHPKANGDISHPDLASVRKQISSAEVEIESRNFGAAANAAEAARKATIGFQTVLNEYHYDAQNIAQVAAQLDSLKSKALLAPSFYDQARRLLEIVKASYERGDSDYRAKLVLAKKAVNLTSSRITSANEFKTFINVVSAGFFGLVGFGTIGGLVAAARRSSNKREQAQKLVKDWTQLLDDRVEAMMQIKEQKENIIGKSRISGFKGKTEQCAQSLNLELANLFTIQVAARQCLERACKLLRPSLKKMFSTASADEAIAILCDRPVEFSPDAAQELELVIRGKKLTRNAFTARPEDLKAFSASFNEVMETFSTNAEAARQHLESIEKSTLSVAENTRNFEKQITIIDDAVKAIDETTIVGTVNTMLPSFHAKLKPALQKALEETRQLSIQDPIGAQEYLTEWANIADKAYSLIMDLSKAKEGSLKTAAANAEEIKKLGFQIGYIERNWQELMKVCDETLATFVNGKANLKLPDVVAQAKTIEEQAASGAALASLYRTKLLPELSNTDTSISEVQVRLGNKLGLAPEMLLCEKSADPHAALENARTTADQVAVLIENADFQKADAAIAEARGFNRQACELVYRSEETVLKFSARQAELEKLAAEIKDRFTTHEHDLKTMMGKYTEEALQLRTDDPSHPRSNDSIDDNMVEAHEALADASGKLTTAIKLFSTGALLEAREELELMYAGLAFAELRLAEINEKKERLVMLEKSCRETEARVVDLKESLAKKIQDPKVRQVTIEQYQECCGALTSYQKNSRETKTNPYKLEKEIKAIADAYSSLECAIETDVEAEEKLRLKHEEKCRAAEERHRRETSLRSLSLSDWGVAVGSASSSIGSCGSSSSSDSGGSSSSYDSGSSGTSSSSW